MKDFSKMVAKVIFLCKWLLIPFYLYLFWTLIVLMFEFIHHSGHITNEVLMTTLEAVDVVMIANLVKMIITGSYNSFVSKNHDEESDKVSSGLLKVKMLTSIMGVLSIHLLQTFIKTTEHKLEWTMVWQQVVIYGVVVVGAIALAYVDFLHHKGDSFGTNHH